MRVGVERRIAGELRQLGPDHRPQRQRSRRAPATTASNTAGTRHSPNRRRRPTSGASTKLSSTARVIGISTSRAKIQPGDHDDADGRVIRPFCPGSLGGGTLVLRPAGRQRRDRPWRGLLWTSGLEHRRRGAFALLMAVTRRTNQAHGTQCFRRDRRRRRGRRLDVRGMTAGARGRRVLLLDHTPQAGAKILISGGGRCNFTNRHARPSGSCRPTRTSAAPRCALHAADFLGLVQAHGIACHEKTLGQLFCDGSARAIVAMLLAECAAAGVELRLGSRVTEVSRADRFSVDTERARSRRPAWCWRPAGCRSPRWAPPASRTTWRGGSGCR